MGRFEDRILEEFFKERFKRTRAEEERISGEGGYYSEWVERFRSGHPERYMDNQSVRAFAEVLRKEAKRIEEVI